MSPFPLALAVALKDCPLSEQGFAGYACIMKIRNNCVDCLCPVAKAFDVEDCCTVSFFDASLDNSMKLQSS